MATELSKSQNLDVQMPSDVEQGIACDESTNFGVDEKNLLRKLDLHLVPLVMLLYTFSFLDRVNIGNARLYGLEEDLGLSPKQFQIAVSIVFVTYIIFELPSNLVLKPLTPQRWLAFISIVWGILALAIGFVHNFGSLVALRVLLGAFEAGLFPALNVYLTFFYTKRELALRVGYLFVSAAIAGALGGLLAYGIGHLDGARGMRGWRWIMIIEGIPTIILGILTLFLLPNDPEHAYFLTDNEKRLMAARHQRQYGYTESAQKFSKKDMMKAFKDWRVWCFCVGQFGGDTMLYSFSVFLPTIIQGLGSWTRAEIQLLTIPCYAVGAISYMTIAYVSDRKQRRGIFCVIWGVISVIGYGILLSDTSAGVHYFACFLIATGLYVLVGLPLAWLPNNSPRYGKRTTASGLQLTIGNSSGIMASFIYASSDAPRYIKGNSIALSLVGLAAVAFGVLWFSYARENKRRDEGVIKPEYASLSEEALAELGDESPRFRYTI